MIPWIAAHLGAVTTMVLSGIATAAGWVGWTNHKTHEATRRHNDVLDRRHGPFTWETHQAIQWGYDGLGQRRPPTREELESEREDADALKPSPYDLYRPPDYDGPGTYGRHPYDDED